MKAELIEKIEDYLQGVINRTQLETYALNTGIVDLDEKIVWVQDTALAAEAVGLKEQLSSLLEKKDMAPSEAAVRKLHVPKWIIGVAASLLLIAVANFLFSDGNSSSEMYANYEYQEPGLPVLMSQTENYLLSDALTYFSEENYTIAIEKLSTISNPQNDTVTYFLGASYYYQDQFEKAINLLVLDNNSVFSEKTAWLRVMSFLKLGNEKQAQEMLADIIANDKHQFHQKAIELKSELNSK